MMRATLVWAALILVGGLALSREVQAQSTGDSGSGFLAPTGSTGSTGSTSSSGGLGQALSDAKSLLSNTTRTSGSASFESNGGEMLMGNKFLRSARGAKNFIGADRDDQRNFLGYATTSGSNSGNSSTGRSSGNSSDSSSSSRRSATNNSNRTGSSQRAGGTASNRRNTAGTANPTRREDNLASGSNTPNNARRAAQFAPVVSLGFEQAPAENLHMEIATRLQQTNRLSFSTPAQVVVRDRVATLSGTVATEHERVLAESLLVLEPGINRVENRLTVAGQPVAPAPVKSEPAASVVPVAK